MLAFADVMHLFADKLSCLRAGRFSFLFILLCAFQSFLFGHNILLLRTSDAAPQTGDGVELPSNCDAVLLALIFFLAQSPSITHGRLPNAFLLAAEEPKPRKIRTSTKKACISKAFSLEFPPTDIPKILYQAVNGPNR